MTQEEPQKERPPHTSSTGSGRELSRRRFLKRLGGTIVGIVSPCSHRKSFGKEVNNDSDCPQGQFYDYTVGRCKEDPLKASSKPLLTHQTDLDLGILKYETDENAKNFDGKIYDGHNHIWLIPETFFLQWGCDGRPQGFIRPLPIYEQFAYWCFYAKRLGFAGSVNLSFPNPGGNLTYRSPEPGLPCEKANIGGGAGVYHNAASLYTKIASRRQGRYNTFAFGSLDYRFLPDLVDDADSMAEIKERSKSRLRKQVKLLSDIGFDGLKLKQERFRGTKGPFMWGAGLDIEGLPKDFWELNGNVFMHVWEKVAEEDMAVTFHLDDSGSVRQRDKYWSKGGVLEKILSRTPGLTFIVAHGFGPLFSGGLKYRRVFDQDGHDPEGECQRGWDQLTRLLQKFNGKKGKAKLYVDFITESFMYMADELHNNENQGRNWVIDHSDSIFIGVDPIAAAARDYQSGGKRHEIENRYFRIRKLLETNRPVKKWTGSSFIATRGLDLPKDALDDLYRENVLSIVNRGKKPVNRKKAADYILKLAEKVKSQKRGYSRNKDPMVEDLKRTARSF